MARRIVSYQVADLSQAILETFEKTYEFLKDSYQGFYCAVCDGSMQKFFDFAAKKITISESFCRTIISNSLNTISYLRVRIPKLVNLLSVFVTNCDRKGKFFKKEVGEPVYMDADMSNEKMIGQCMKYRNLQNWLRAIL